jgi:hypothetical protein
MITHTDMTIATQRSILYMTRFAIFKIVKKNISVTNYFAKASYGRSETERNVSKKTNPTQNHALLYSTRMISLFQRAGIGFTTI